MALSLSSQRLFEFLASEPSAQDARNEELLLTEIDEQRERTSMASLTATSFIRLNHSRVSVSQSILKNPDALKKWNEGQALIHKWLLSDRAVGMSDLIELNALLSASPSKGWRERDIYTLGVKHIDAQEIDAVMQALFSQVILNAQKKHLLYVAFAFRYWIVSIHPFADGNGRSSQLFADYILLKHGYLPQAFCSMLEHLIIGHHEYRPYMNPHHAFGIFSKTILNAYQIVNSP